MAAGQYAGLQCGERSDGWHYEVKIGKLKGILRYVKPKWAQKDKKMAGVGGAYRDFQQHEKGGKDREGDGHVGRLVGTARATFSGTSRGKGNILVR